MSDHYYIRATSQARKVRDAHLAATPIPERPSLKATYDEFIEGLLNRQKVWTAAYTYRVIEQEGHGYPKVLREGTRMKLLFAFFIAATDKDWPKVNEAREALVRFGL